MIQDDVVAKILSQAMEEQFSKARPATRHFFEHQAPEEGQERTVIIHKWVVSKITDSDNELTVRHLANSAVKEVVSVAAQITGEIVFRNNHLLPSQPVWEDDVSLFNHPASTRFGVKGGNVVGSINCFEHDVRRAADRLEELDQDYEGDERLLLFCAKPLEKKLIRAAAKAQVACRVFGLYNYKNERAWVLTRDLSPCSLLIGKPSFSLPVEGNVLLVGARFVVWINDPRYAVCVAPTSAQQESPSAR